MKNYCIEFDPATLEFRIGVYPLSEQELNYKMVAKNISEPMANEFVLMMETQDEQYLNLHRIKLDWTEYKENCL